jgi:hypothetical protein
VEKRSWHYSTLVQDTSNSEWQAFPSGTVEASRGSSRGGEGCQELEIEFRANKGGNNVASDPFSAVSSIWNSQTASMVHSSRLSRSRPAVVRHGPCESDHGGWAVAIVSSMLPLILDWSNLSLRVSLSYHAGSPYHSLTIACAAHGPSAKQVPVRTRYDNKRSCNSYCPIVTASTPSPHSSDV